MSQIELSAELFQDIQGAVDKQCPDADAGLTMQYLAAVMGYMLSTQNQMSDQDKSDYLNELCGFAKHVFDDSMARQKQQQQAMASQAFGYWNPPNKA